MGGIRAFGEWCVPPKKSWLRQASEDRPLFNITPLLSREQALILVGVLMAAARVLAAQTYYLRAVILRVFVQLNDLILVFI